MFAFYVKLIEDRGERPNKKNIESLDLARKLIFKALAWKDFLTDLPFIYFLILSHFYVDSLRSKQN